MMKYLFFDCHGGFDLQMAVSALIDMTDNKDIAMKALELIGIKAELISSRVTRCGMDAYLAYADFEVDENKSINDIIDSSRLDDKIRSRLKLWSKLKSDGRPYNPQKEQRSLIYASLCLSIIESIDAERIYISDILQGNAMGTDGAEFKFIPSAHTELLCKMAGLHTSPANIAKEILEPDAAAMLYILNAEYLAPRVHNVIKSGYGASDTDLMDIPNIARCIIADDGEATEIVYRDFEAIISDMNMSCV